MVFQVNEHFFAFCYLLLFECHFIFFPCILTCLFVAMMISGRVSLEHHGPHNSLSNLHEEGLG